MTRHVVSRRGLATDELRRHNLGAVLDRIHLAGPVSRSELAESTGLNRSTIGDLVAELAGLGLVTEGSGSATGNRGRPSALAHPRPAGAVVLAVELEVDYTAVATVGLGGQIIDRASAPNPSPSAPPEVVIDHLDALAVPLLAGLPKHHRMVGIGVAAAGLVRRRDGVIGYSPNRGWSGVPLGDMLSERFRIGRVCVANEADTGALAEFRRGAGRAASTLVYVSGAVGLGLGVIHEGRAMAGMLGYAGEAGHAVINPAGRQCRCGSVGCWETEVGQEALARHGGLEPSQVGPGLADEVLRRAHIGDREMLDALREVGTWLGLGVGNLVNIFNPELIVFGGFYAPLFPFLEHWIAAAGERAALGAAWEACAIRRSGFGRDARLVGASELVFAEVIADLPAAVA